VGLNADKYIPLGKMTASDALRLELTLENAKIPLVTASAAGTGEYTVTDVEYVAQIVKLSDDAEAMVSRATGGVYRVHGDSFRSFNSTVTSGVNTASINIPVKVSSLKTLFVSHRLQGSTTQSNAHCISNRSRAEMTEYYFQVGSVRLPQKPVKIDTNGAEAHMELQKALHILGTKRAVCSYTLTEWTLESNHATGHGAFVVGMDMESFSGKSDTMNQGVSTISQPLFANFTYNSVPASMVVTSIAHFDQVLEIDTASGIARVMF